MMLDTHQPTRQPQKSWQALGQQYFEECFDGLAAELSRLGPACSVVDLEEAADGLTTALVVRRCSRFAL